MVLVFVLVLTVMTPAAPILADEDSVGYQLALIQERARYPEKQLTGQEIRLDNATVREFEWILETLANRCLNPPKDLPVILVTSWRITQRRGYKEELLEFCREVARYAAVASQEHRNQKVNLETITLKWLKVKYPIKK